jgi:pyruvate formate lyase activating enzyme
MKKEAKMYKKMDDKKVMCTACARNCRLGPKQVGFCGVRQNIGGKLYLLVYGKVASSHVDPIEKKPVFHFMPGSKIFSFGTTGCNFACAYCCNFDLSQRRNVEGTDMTPKQIVGLAKKYECEGIAYTYNQPTIFIEFAHDVGLIARKENLVNIFVSNGFDTPETVKYMKDFLDSITIDLKGNAEQNFLRKHVGILSAEPIFQTLLELKNKTKIHIEITDLIVPKIGDDLKEAEKVCKWVVENLGDETPIQFLRFHPTYKLIDLPVTPVETLEKHYEVAKKAGLKYAYLGNVPGHKWEHTYCPECKKVVIGRFGFDITGWSLDEKNNCKFCGNPIPIIGNLSKSVKDKRFFSISDS